MNREKEKSQCCSCYSGAVASILNNSGMKILEKELFYSKYLLSLYCTFNTESIYSNITKIVKDCLEERGIKFQQVQINSFNKLKEVLDSSLGILMHIDCKKLDYSSVFVKAITNQRMHYIELKDVQKNYLLIKDYYIPEMPIASYHGKLTIEESYIGQIEFEVLYGISEMKNNSVEIKGKLKDILQVYKTQSSVFQQAISNFRGLESKMITGDQRKRFLYEAATALSVSGTITIRKVLFIIMEQSELFPKNLLDEVKRLVSKYNTFRIMLLKEYVGSSESNLEQIINKLSDIYLFENELCKKASEIILD
ncbi:MAG: hypothetical protein UFG06_03455 [Lachnospiraceae bacterium]|nr:hypothetical protein [Lachnospiraceae bacterium]